MRYFALIISVLSLIITTLVAEGGDAQANEISVTGMGCERYTELTPMVKDKAERVAKEAAWKKFKAAELTRSQKTLYKKNKNTFLEALDDMIPPEYIELFDRLGADDGSMMLPFEVWREAFINDASLELAQETYGLLNPHPRRTFAEPIKLDHNPAEIPVPK